MVQVPESIREGQDSAVVLQRAKDAYPADLSTIEGSFAGDALLPFALEAADLYVALELALRLGFAQTTDLAHLLLRAEERGVAFREATAAEHTLEFTGAPGTVIAAGTLASTAGPASAVFETLEEATVGGGGTVEVAARATVAGTGGNVPLGSVQFLNAPVAGVTAVTNVAELTAGTDDETRAQLLARYLQRVREPSAGGNRADYTAWALEVAGVGNVAVSLPGEGAPAVVEGNVRLSLVDADGAPATLALCDAVLTHILDPRRHGPYEAEGFTRSGFGTSIDASQTDDSGSSVKLVYHASGEGQAAQGDVQDLLAQPGIHLALVRAKVDDDGGADPLLRVGMWNVAAGAWCTVSPSSAVEAYRDFAAADLATAFPDADHDLLWPSVDFHSPGEDELELRVIRLQDDTTTQVWVDQVRYRSAGASQAGEPLSPAGARVAVQPAAAVEVDLSADLTIDPDFDADEVKAAAEDAYAAYLAGLTFQAANDVVLGRAGAALLDVPGVLAYDPVTIELNGAQQNVAIPAESVAVKGTVAFTP